jgi:hypothetical protein
MLTKHQEMPTRCDKCGGELIHGKITKRLDGRDVCFPGAACKDCRKIYFSPDDMQRAIDDLHLPPPPL